MRDRSRPERLQIMLNPDEMRAVDDWRFARRMPSRASAIRELLKRGLAVDDVNLQTDGRQSASFGVLDDRKNKDEKQVPASHGTL